MAFDILGFYNKHKDYYGDQPLDKVAKDVYTRAGYDKEYKDFDTWAKQEGVEQHVQEDLKRRNPPKEGLGTELLRLPKSFLQGAAEGITTELPSMVGGAIEFAASHAPFKGIEETGKSIKDWAEEKRKELYGPEIERTGLDRIVYEGTKMLAPSILPGGIVGTAARGFKGVSALAKAGKVAEATAAAKSATNIAGGSVAGLFGLSQAQQTKDTAEAEGVEPGIAPYLTGAIEAAGEFLGTKYLAKLFRLDEAEVVKRGAKALAKDLIKTVGVEVGTEIGQAGGEAAVEKFSGIRPNASPIGEAIDVIGPTIFMTLLTAGLAGGANKLRETDPESAKYLEKMKIGAIASMSIKEGLATGQLDGDPFTPENALEIIREGQSSGIYDSDSLERFKERYPQLRDGLNGVITEGLIKKIDEVASPEPRPDSISQTMADMERIKKIIPAPPSQPDAATETGRVYKRISGMDEQTGKATYTELIETPLPKLGDIKEGDIFVTNDGAFHTITKVTDDGFLYVHSGRNKKHPDVVTGVIENSYNAAEWHAEMRYKKASKLIGATKSTIDAAAQPATLPKPPKDSISGKVEAAGAGKMINVAPDKPQAEAGLIEEARKYKSADDFVKAQGRLAYHGTERTGDRFEEFSHFGTKKAAQERINNEGYKNATIHEVVIPRGKYRKINDVGSNHAIDIAHEIGGLKLTLKAEKAFLENLSEKEIADVVDRLGFIDKSNISIKDILDASVDQYNRLNKRSSDILDVLGDPREYFNKKATDAAYAVVKDYAKSKGINGFFYKNAIEDKGKTSFVIIDTTKVKTKSQLTDIWDKAVGREAVGPVIPGNDKSTIQGEDNGKDGGTVVTDQGRKRHNLVRESDQEQRGAVAVQRKVLSGLSGIPGYVREANEDTGEEPTTGIIYDKAGHDNPEIEEAKGLIAEHNHIHGKTLGVVPINDKIILPEDGSETSFSDGFISQGRVFINTKPAGFRTIKQTTKHELSHDRGNEDIQEKIDRESDSFKEFHEVINQVYRTEKSIEFALEEYAADIEAGLTKAYGINLEAGLLPGNTVESISKELENKNERQRLVSERAKKEGGPAGKETERIRKGGLRAAPKGRESKFAIAEKPEGHRVTAPAESYDRGVANNGNVWVRQSTSPSNSGRQLLVQFSTELINKDSKPDSSTEYYDKLYSGKREGYDRLRDFWEIPQWMGFVSNYLPNADVYVVRDMKEAKEFLKEAGYDRIIFSSIDVNKSLIKEISNSFKGQVDIGGYTAPGTFDDLKNAKWHENLESLAKDLQVPFKEGVDYRHFEGSKVIPRLTMSQGCLHKCAFCTVPKQLIETNTEVIDQQAEAFGALDAKLVYLNDKTFGQAKNYRHLEDVYQIILKKNPGFKGFIIQTTGSQLLKMDDAWLQRSGIKYVELGVETYNNAILKALHKPHNESILDRAAQKLRENKIAFVPNIIVGIKEETRDTYQRTLDFIDRNADIISHENIYNLALYEGSELATKLNATTESDLDENVREKSFHKDPKIHDEFAETLFEKGKRGLDDVKFAISLGERVKDSKEIAKILLKSPAKSGPLDGGCLIMARALKRIEPTGKIITLEGQLPDKSWQPEHYGFELDGVIDGYGYAKSRTEWAKRFAENESLTRPYRVTEGQLYSDEIPQDVPTEKLLAAALIEEPEPRFAVSIKSIIADAKKNGTYLKAPNGEDTLLDEDQWAIVRTIAFKNWFGDWEKGNIWGRDDVSKVVDKNGEPLVVFHGTQKGGFSILNPGERDKHEVPSTFFTDARGMASTYSGTRGIISLPSPKAKKDLEAIGWEFEKLNGEVRAIGPNDATDDYFETMKEAVAWALKQPLTEYGEHGIYPVFLNIRGPLESDFEGANWNGSRVGQYMVLNEENDPQDINGTFYASLEEAKEYAEKNGGEVEPAWDHYETTNSVVREAKKYKNDGAIIRNVTDSGGRGYHFDPADVFVIFDSNQAKSATQNTGEFNPKNEDMRFAIRLTNKRSLGARILAGMEKPSPKVGSLITQIATHLSRESAKEGVIDHRTAGPKENKQVEKALADMIEASILKHPESIGWYRADIERTMLILGEIYPDLKKPSDNFWMRAAIALTSDGNKTMKNMELAELAYKSWKSTGSIVAPMATKRGSAISENLRFAEAVRKGFKSDKEFEKWLLGKAPAGEIAGDLVAKLNMNWEDAKAVVSGENLDAVVPRSVIFGPKIGAFFANLSGDFTPVTMDMWFMRTMGRIQGNLMEGDTQEEIDQERARLKKAIEKSPQGMRFAKVQPNLFGLDDVEIDHIAKEISTKSTDENFRDKLSLLKGGDELRNAANARNKHLKGGTPIDAPRSGAHRQWLRDRVNATRETLDNKYENADIQATIWIGEKEIYNAYGSKPTQGDYFSDGANALYEKLHGRPSQFYAGAPGQVAGESRTSDKQVPLFAVSAVDKIYELAKDNPQGFTINISDGTMITKGWAVSPSKMTETPVTTFTPKVLEDFLFRFKPIFDSDERAFFGGWYDDDPKSKNYGRFVLDVSFVVDNKEDAAYMGDIGEQDGIVDLENKEYARVEDAIRELKESGLYDESKRTELRRIRENMHRVMQESRDVRGEDVRQPRGIPKRGEEQVNFAVSLTHWSRVPDLKFTDPSKYGTGYAGAEKVQRDNYPELWIDKTFAGYGSYKMERNLGAYRYKMDVNPGELYNAKEDPKNLFPTAEQTQKMGYYKGPAQGLIYERNIKKAGYKGYISPDYNVAVLFEKMKVTKVPTSNKVIKNDDIKFAVGQVLRESPAPIEKVDPILLPVNAPMKAIIDKAKGIYESWPDEVKSPDGFTFYPKNPQEGRDSKRVWHLLQVDDSFDPQKARWMPSVVETVKNASKIIEDDRKKTGKPNRIYVRAYRDGSRHFVVADSSGYLVEQDKLTTQFPKAPFKETDITAQDRMRIVWERKAATPAGTPPDTAASKIAGSQQTVFQERDATITEQKNVVKGNFNEPKFAVSSPEFKRWFGDSKVVDENGEPLVVYHGTKNSFNEFDVEKHGVVFFTPDKSSATNYAYERSEGSKGHVFSTFLKMENPEIIDYKGKGDNDIYQDAVDAQADGKDGLIALNTDDGNKIIDQYAVFSPTQIKSATGNVGTFDENNPDIRFQRRNQDARYLELAKDPEKNKAELQKMVDEAAKKAGYNVEGLGAVYHGTPNVKHNDKWVVAISQIHDIILPDEPPLRHDVSPFDENTEHYDRFWQFQRFLSANYYRNLQNKIPENLRYTYELGQSVPFTTFDETLRGSTTEAADAKRGFFFTKDEPFAHRFRTSYEYDPFTRVTKVVKGPGPIYKVYLKTGNVLDLTKMSAEQSKMGQQYGDLDGYDTVINKVKWRPSMNRAASKVTQEIMVKSASQIKSSDPITYDDNGNVIPLSERFNPENPDIRYQRGNSTGLQQSAVQSIINKAVTAIPNAPKVNVVQGNENCPDEVQKIMEREGIDDAMGFTYKGEVYLVSDNLQNTEEVLRTLVHELTHSGLGKFFQRQRMSRALVPVRAQYEALMDAIYRAHHKEIEQIAKTTHTHLNTRTAKDRRQACEEWLCNQSYEAQPKWYDKLVAIFHDLLRAIGLDVKLSDAEVRVVLQDAFKEFGSEGVSFMTAWHGSPHDFDKFSKDKIGTGEGAQAYGYGLYFAGKKEVGEYYRKSFIRGLSYDNRGVSVDRDTVDVRYVDSNELVKDDAARLAILSLYHNMSLKQTGGEFFWGDNVQENIKMMNDAQTLLSSGVVKKATGRLYQVELAPAEDEYLLWDKPLSEQSEKVKAALEKTDSYKKEAFDSDMFPHLTGNLLYGNVADTEGSQKAASDYLHSLGIRGIKYLDGSSRNKGEGDYNYVIFSDEDVEVTAKFQRRPQQDPPTSRDPKVLNLYLKDETDALIQTMMNKLHPPHMTWLETILKSPEWFSHPQIQNIVKLFMRDRNEIYHETFNDLNMADDIDAPESTVTEAAKALKNKGLTLADRLAGKVSPEYQRLQDIIDEGDTSWKRNTSIPLDKQIKEFEKHIRQQGATEDTIRVWKLYRQSYDKALDLQTAQLRQMIDEITEEANFRGEKPDLRELKQSLKGALAQMEEWRGFYAPRLREQGNWKIQAYKEHGPMKENREWYREHRGSELSARRLANKMQREGWKIYSVGQVEKLPETIYQDVNAAATAKLIDAALEKLSKKSALSNELTLKFNEEVLREVSNAIKARGFRSTMIRRGEKVVRGFIEDPIQRHLQYINSLSGGISKARVARMAMAEMLGERFQGKQVGGIDPVTDPKAFQVAQNYIEEQLRNVEPIDRMIGLAKSIATFKFLGFNLRSLAVNTTAIITTAPAAIHQYALNGKGSMMGIIKELAVSGKDYGALMAGRKLANADEQAFLDEVQKKGWDDAQYTREALGEISKTHSRIWSSMMDGSMYLFGKSEKWNRGTTMLAAYRLARKQGMGHGEASELAKESADKAHGVYGKSTMPMWAQGTNPAAKVGQLFYVYQKFGHNYLQMLYDMGLKKHNIKGAMFAFLSPLVLAGGMALPFKDAIFGFAGFILKALFGEDRDPEKWVWDEIRKHLGMDAEKIGRHGLTGAMGVDISGSLSAGVGIPKNFIDLTGAIGGVATELKEAKDSIRNKQYGKAAEHLLPTGLANPIRAMRESEQGVTTRNNRRVWDEQGKAYKPAAGATVARAIGFRSTDQAVLSERTWEGHRQQSDFAEKRNAIYERYRAWALGKRDREEYKKIVADVQKYNKTIRENRISGVSPITSQSLQSQARRLAAPSKNERALLQN